MVLCVGLGVVAGEVLAAKGDTSLISRRSASAGGQGADGDSLSPSVSRIGRFVAFYTDADNLGGPARNVANIYVYDRRARKVELVSRRSGAGGKGVNAGAFDPEISSTGRFVAFSTEATNLGGPAKNVSNIYVYDRSTRTVELISRRSASAGGAGANGDSFSPAISADGRFVAFDTDATNLGGPASVTYNVYVYDREQDRVEMVSRRSAAAGGQGANGNSFGGSISGSGRFVPFSTDATNLGGPAQAATNVYVYDRGADRVELVSRRSAAAGGQGADDSADSPTISGTGRFVAFRTRADNLGGPIQTDVGNVYVYDRTADRVALVSRQSASAGGQGGNANSGPGGVLSLSAGGRFVAFDTDASNLGGPVKSGTNVYVYDRKSKRIVLASRRPGAGGANGPANGRDPSLSGDGRFVAFWSEATNLGGPINAERNVYIHQHLLGP